RFFSADQLRYTLAVNLPESRDSDFYFKDFQARVNNELANILGNFINRTFAFTEKNFGGVVPAQGSFGTLDKEIIALLKETPAKVGELYEHYRFRDAVLESMNLARKANKYFNDSEPWETAKNNPAQCATTLHVSLQIIRSLAILFEPVIPAMSLSVWTMLNLDGRPTDAGWESAANMVMKENHQLNKSGILVTKIEDKTVQDVVNTLMSEPAVAETKSPEMKPTITVDDFKKIDLRTAKVVAAEKVAKSDKLLKLQIELGGQTRQVIAGIAKHYQPQDLVGKLIVVVANLQPAKLMGLESQGMILAASDNEGRLSVIGPLTEIPTGSIVK
ncbi:MAG TPA: methionine--tRNA ligase subunit beta, partial [Bacteroidota bacterium]